MANTLGGGCDGMLSEYRVLPDSGLVRIPDHLSFEEASTLPCAALTAWNALFGAEGLNRLLPGQTVVVQGTGGVSCFGAMVRCALSTVTMLSRERIRPRVLVACVTLTYPPSIASVCLISSAHMLSLSARDPRWSQCRGNFLVRREAQHPTKEPASARS